MPYKILPKHFKATLELSNEDRYFHFIAKVVEYEELWGVKNEEGWFFSATAEGAEYFPVWPHPDYAEKVCKKNIPGYEPELIDLGTLMEHWLPGMAKDGVKLAIFPEMNWQAMMLDAEVVLEDLSEQYEMFHSDEEEE